MITKESLSSNFKTVFGEYNEYFSNVLYYYLSKGYELVNVTLVMFINKMKLFLDEDKSKVMNALFNLFDTNQDGVISIMDLMHSQAFVPCDSQFGEEISMMLNKYVQDVVMSRSRRVIFNINLKNFDLFLSTS